MQTPALRQLAQQFTLYELKAAEHALTEGNPLPIDVPGNDEGEQLTHLLGAIWIKEHMAAENVDLPTALRRFAERVRGSIN
jgi:hypothetical protein